MQIVAYLGFTLLSVFIQFSVIDFIQGRLKLEESPIESKGISYKRQLRDVLEEVSFKPHALYYQIQKNKQIKTSPAKFISNITLITTTDLTTTVFDVLYDENSTNAEESSTTESFYTTTDIENFTEISLFEKINETIKPDTTKVASWDCGCNLQLKVCDINCCCDVDCLDSETMLFPNCINQSSTKDEILDDNCVYQLSFLGYESGLFCIVKVNLPENRNLVITKTEAVPTNNHAPWKTNGNSQIYEFSNSMYKYGDPIWLSRNGTIYHLDLPVSTVNSYCTGRKAMQFLKDEKYICNVKIRDLEMFQIEKSLEEVTIISATPLSMNSSVLNCSSLHCVNWTMIVCKNLVCTNYSKSLHEPTCTEITCTNLALKLDYIFYYHDLKIINATIKFHLENVTGALPFLSQEINVKFVVGNGSIDKIIKLSGNPGYLNGLPIIISYAENNYTDGFYNSTMQLSQRYWILPENKNGICTLFNSSENYVLFGRNRRVHCRYNHKSTKISNATERCRSIQKEINMFIELKRQILVSPLGNPHNLKDEEWVSIEKTQFNGTTYGEVQDRSSKLLCFNFVSRYSMIFGYAQINGNNRMMFSNYATTANNVSFNMDDISSVITIDISFVQMTTPNVIEYVGSRPSLNIHLPEDFLQPFRSSESRVKCDVFMILCCVTYFLQIK